MNPKVIYKSEIIHDLIVFQIEKFSDDRGSNFEGYNHITYNQFFKEHTNIKKEVHFPVISYSRSKKNVIRGLHGDQKNWKLIDILKGQVYFVVVDTRKKSPTYMNVEEFNLSEVNLKQVLVPAGCVNGHCVLSEECLFHYLWSDGYVSPENQISLKWNDPKLNINWPINDPILSDRDR